VIEFENEKQYVNVIEERKQKLNEQGEYRFGLLGLEVVKELLAYKDLRSVIKWCKKNDVFILHQGNGQFVNEYEFTLSLYKPFIQALKLKHSNWKVMFLNYLNGELDNLLTTSNEQREKICSTKYKPKTKVEASFLDKIKNI
jgi:hypothetical protein